MKTQIKNKTSKAQLSVIVLNETGVLNAIKLFPAQAATAFVLNWCHDHNIETVQLEVSHGCHFTLRALDKAGRGLCSVSTNQPGPLSKQLPEHIDSAAWAAA